MKIEKTEANSSLGGCKEGWVRSNRVRSRPIDLVFSLYYCFFNSNDNYFLFVYSPFGVLSIVFFTGKFDLIIKEKLYFTK